jgi:hypothetical protein
MLPTDGWSVCGRSLVSSHLCSGSETRNLFLVAERRGRLKAGDAALSMTQLRSLPLQEQGTGGDHVVLALAARHALSGYDASYLALSVQLALPLVSNDRPQVGGRRARGKRHRHRPVGRAIRPPISLPADRGDIF